MIIKNCEDYDLKKSWKAHGDAHGVQGLQKTSANLLLFYAVECGLKYLYLREKNLKKCPKYNRDPFRSHDLKKILMSLNPPQAGLLPALEMKLMLQSGASHVELHDVHLAWRYGLSIEPNNEAQILAWLRNVNSFIEKRMKKP
ncbi:MAG: hypothetical protein H7831_06430 [Magnetococcus sp. WYHC-3]